MKLWVLHSAVFVAGVLSSLPALAQSSLPNLKDPAEQEITIAARARAAALSNHDCDQWASFVSDDFQDIESFQTESQTVLLKGCEDEKKSACKSDRELSDFHFRFTGNFAFVYYLYKITDHCGEYAFPNPHRQVDTYEKRNGKWVALYAVEVPQVEDPPAVKIDPALLDKYTGEYAWEKAKLSDTVTLKGDKLYIQTTGDKEPTELVPDGGDTFFVRGSLNRNTFIRDGNGKIAEIRGYSADAGEQRGYKAKRIR